MTNMRMKKNLENEKGAVVIEATISLTLFMFLIVTLLSVVNMCTAQVKIGTALNQAAKELSEFTYIYGISGINDLQKLNYDNADDTRQDANEILNSICGSMNAIEKLGNGSGTAWEAVDSVSGTAMDAEALMKKIATSEDPSAWLKDIARIAANEGYEFLKGRLTGVIAKSLMVKNLTLSDYSECDGYLKRVGVVGGLSGLKCGNSTVFLNGSDDIILNCQYDLEVVEFFGETISFHISLYAYTKVWGGKSLVNPNATNADGSGASSAALVGTGEGEEFGIYAARAKKESGYVDVIIHADPSGKSFTYIENGVARKVDNKELADYIRSHVELHKDDGIRLISCGAGANNSSLAQDLANELGVKVKAPNQIVWAYPNGELKVESSPGAKDGEWVDFEPNK